MDHQDSINICLFEQSEELLFSDLSGPLRSQFSNLVNILTLWKLAAIAKF